MKKIILIGLILTLIPIVNANIILDLNYQISKFDEVEKIDLKLNYGRETAYATEGDYKLEILDINNNILISQKIQLNFMVFTNPPQPLENTNLIYKINYNPEMHKLKIYNKDEIIYEEEIILCNFNNICDEFENHISCPSDCPLNEPDGLCIPNLDGVCDPDCMEGVDPDCSQTTTTTIQQTTTTLQQKEKANNNLMLYIVGSIILILILFLIFRKKKEQKEDYSEILNRLEK